MRFLSLFSTVFLILLSFNGLSASEANQFNNGRISGSSRNSPKKKSDPFNANRAGNFNDYRVSLNAEYARQIKEYEWRQQKLREGEHAPDQNIKPVSPIQWEKGNDNENKEKEIAIDEVIKPIKRDNKAKPIAPVVVPEEEKGTPANLSIKYLGSNVQLHAPSSKLTLENTSQTAIADLWTRLSQPDFAQLIADCIKYKQSASLCDWAYLIFLESTAKAIASNDNTVAILMAYLASQSGYSIRLATTDNGRLDMLYASQHLIYNRPYLISDNQKYYPYFTNSNSYKLCQSHFKSETGISLWIPRLPQVKEYTSEPRTIQSKRYSSFRTQSSVNKNLISFYDTYPTSQVGTNPVSRWAMYANTPVSDNIRQTLYPQIRNQIAGLSHLEAVERILNWIQTGFVYEYDDKVWGGDRAFFAEESLYYPYCDCEDRSILLTRIVRDLLGLKCLLVFYPGHLAAAINFPENVTGDYIMHAGKKFTISDPTYIGAPVGSTMPKMDNSTAKIILLE